MQILLVVAAKRGENPRRRKGKGFVAMIVSHELVGPKGSLKMATPKGKPVNIPIPRGYVRQR